ncbi:MAG: hypothetical protein ABSF52_04875 [Syntrophobacteraceae bacterium]|jgi:hypothetical protein
MPGILTSASDDHIYLKLGSTRKKIAERYLRVVRIALDNGIVPRCAFEDITRTQRFPPCSHQFIERMVVWLRGRLRHFTGFGRKNGCRVNRGVTRRAFSPHFELRSEQ